MWKVLTEEQTIRYSDTIGAKYIVVTNGIELKIAAYEENTDNYVFLDKILSYGQMINKDYTLLEYKEEKGIRFSLDDLRNQELLMDYNESGSWIFGEDTPDVVRTFVVNMYQVFLDTGHKLPIVKRKNFELLEDLGQRFMDYGNAGGGHYNGVYRAFLVNDRFVKLLPEGKAEFIHNGQISSIKSEDIISIVFEYGDELRFGLSGIEIGTIDIDKLLYLDDNDVFELIYNFIEYALLKEEVRRRKKRCM